MGVVLLLLTPPQDVVSKEYICRNFGLFFGLLPHIEAL